MGELEWEMRPTTPNHLQDSLKVKLNTFNHIDFEHIN